MNIPFKVWDKLGSSVKMFSKEAIEFLNKDYRRKFSDLNILEKSLLERNLIVKNYFPVIVFIPSEIYHAVKFYGDEYFINKLKFHYNLPTHAEVISFHLGPFNSICPNFEISYKTPVKYSSNYKTGAFLNAIEGGNIFRTIDIITPRELKLIFGDEYYIKMKLRKESDYLSNKEKWREEFKLWEEQDKSKWEKAQAQAQASKVE